MSRRLFIVLSVLSCLFSSVMAVSASSSKPVQYACEEYAGRLVKIPTTGRALVPWPEGDRRDLRFYDAVFISDDDSRVVVVLLKKISASAGDGYEAIFKIYNTQSKLWDDIGKEPLGQGWAVVPVRADSKNFSFIRLRESPGAAVGEPEIVTYSLTDKLRVPEAAVSAAELKRRLFFGKYEVSGLSVEHRAYDYNTHIAAQKFESGGKFYEGIMLIDRRAGTKKEILRFGNKPVFLRHTSAVSFDYKDRRNFMFGFCDIFALGTIYYIDGNNMVFRHYENGINLKEYLNLTRLRAVSRSMTKLLFMAEDDFGARVVVVPVEREQLVR